jgi:hypothetical protein
MNNPRQVIGLLQDARDLVALDWGNANMDVPWESASGLFCASVAITSPGIGDESLVIAAHVALLQAAGIEVPESWDEIYAAVYRWNDAQTNAYAVLGVFTGAIVALEETVGHGLEAVCA